MRIKTKDLVVGDVMASGEVVISAGPVWKSYCKKSLTEFQVYLKDLSTNITRVAFWRLDGTVTIKERKCESSC